MAVPSSELGVLGILVINQFGLSDFRGGETRHNSSEVSSDPYRKGGIRFGSKQAANLLGQGFIGKVIVIAGAEDQPPLYPIFEALIFKLLGRLIAGGGFLVSGLSGFHFDQQESS